MILLNWTAPFTLDIRQIDPDTTYCVDVINSTSSEILHSRCEINANNFSYPVPPGSDCHATLFTVTPVNVVGSGTNKTISFSGVDSGISIMVLHYISVILYAI